MLTTNILTINKTLLYTLADDIALLASENDSISVINTVHPFLNNINSGLKNRINKINEDISVLDNLSFSLQAHSELQVNNKLIPIPNSFPNQIIKIHTWYHMIPLY